MEIAKELATKQYVDDNLKPNDKRREVLMDWFLPTTYNNVFSKKIWDGLTPEETLEKLKTYENFLLILSIDNGTDSRNINIDKLTFKKIGNLEFGNYRIGLPLIGEADLSFYLQTTKWEIQIYKYGVAATNFSNVRIKISAQPGDKYPDPVPN